MILRYTYTFLLLILTPVFAMGQTTYSSKKGGFEVTQRQGCEGLTFEFNITYPDCDCTTSCGPPCEFDPMYDAGDYNGQPFDPNMSYTYPEAGTYTFYILFSNKQFNDEIEITVKDKEPPVFNAYRCTANEVYIDIADTEYDEYIIDFGDGTNTTVPANAPDPVHEYTTPGAKTISVRGQDDNSAPNCPVSQVTLTPQATIPPATITRAEVLNSQELVLNYNIEPSVAYRLQIQANGTGNFNYFKDIATPVDTIRNADYLLNLDFENNFYCFRIATEDLCNDSAPVYSNTLCTIALDIDFTPNKNELIWRTTDPAGNPITEFEIRRNNNLLTTGNSPQRTYTDADISCTTYSYQLIANHATGTSTSMMKTGEAVITAPPESVTDLTASVSEAQLQLSWPQASSSDIIFYVFREGATNPFITTSDNTTIDENAQPAGKSYCYKISTTDSCGNISTTGITACSMLLIGGINPSNEVNLSWNAYQGWADGVASYTIIKTNNSGTSQSAVSTTTFTEIDNSNDQVLYYQVVAIPNDGSLPPAYSNQIVVIKPTNVYAPNAFTPDGDGTNDTFSVKGRFLDSYELTIYNRWGELVFSTHTADSPWNGTVNGVKQPEGTYAYRLQATDMAGRSIEKAGTVLIIRRR